MSSRRPLRVLHVVGGLAMGGVETWLMAVVRETDRDLVAMDVMTHLTSPQVYDDEARALGVAIVPVGSPRRPVAYVRSVRRILREHGPYDVVHSHVHHFSGVVCLLARSAGVPVRIAHSHSDKSHIDAGAGPVRRAYLTVATALVARHATRLLAPSRPAGRSLLGRRWDDDPRCTVMPYGIDLSGFRPLVADDLGRAARRRAELGIPPGAFVVGHVGRFAAMKNHAFLVDVFARLHRVDSTAHLLLVGDGPLRPEIQALVDRHGLARATTFAGLSRDVPAIVRDAVDVFVLPSTHEGSPISLIEAQAAGTPSVVSDVVPEEVLVLPGIVERLALSEGVDEWAAAARRSRPRRRSAPEAFAAVERSPFSVRRSVETLLDVYRGG